MIPDPPSLALTVAIPFATAILIFLIPERQQGLIKLLATLAGALCLALSLWIFVAYNFDRAGFQFQLQQNWLPSLGVTFHLGVDGISVLMVLLTGIVMFTGILVTWGLTYRVKDFFAFLMLLVTGVFGTFQSLDLFFFFFFYELAIIPMYLLLGVWASTRKQYGALKLTIFLTAGSVLVWVGLLATYVAAGSAGFDLLELEKVTFTADFQRFFFPFFLVGFGVLAGLWPFHTWSPDGHVAAPTAVSMLHAGVLMKLGAYGIIRVGVHLFPEGAQTWMPLVLVLATINVVYGAFSAMAQRDLKFVIGYSSVSHMGYVLMGFATLNVVAMNGAVLQMFSHGIMTALLFALVGVIYDQAHTRDIAVFGGLARRMGTVAAFFAVGGLTSMGLPGLSGFVAEFLVFAGTFQTYPIVAVLGIVGALATAVYILRLLALAFLGPLNERWTGLTDMNRSTWAGTAILVFCLVLVGLWPGPFIDRIATSVGPLVARALGAL